jgi:TetR/AcrR family fatty acid metabolism transcriptional regulator
MSSENTAPLHTGLTSEVYLLIIRSDRVVGELPVLEHHCDSQGRASVATLFALSNALCEVGIIARYGAETTAIPHEAKTIALRPARTALLTAEAHPLPAPDGLCAWQTTIRGENDETVAILTQGYLMGAAKAVQPIPVGPVVQTATHQPSPIKMLSTDARVSALLAAGTEVIARKGFANATIREIAEQAGVHVPTFYQHIASKNELLEMVYALEMKQLEDDLDANLRIEGTASERLEGMILSALDISHRRKRQIGILNRELKNLRPDGRARVIAQYRRLIGRYETVIRSGIRTGEFSPSVDPVLAANVADMISDMWALRPFFFTDHALDSFRAQAVSFIMSGLRAVDPGAKPR